MHESTQPLPTDCLVVEPFDVYHGKRNENMSSGQLKVVIENPELLNMKRKGVIKDKDTAAFAFGRALHALTLEGEDAYRAEFICPTDDPAAINPDTNKPYGSNTNAYRDWAYTIRDKTIISPDEQSLVYKISSRIKRHRVAREFLSEGVPEGVVRAEFHGVPCQIRIDHLNPNIGLGDLKSCKNLYFFTADVRKFRYDIQFAFYRAIYREATGITAPFYAIAAEKRDGWRVGVWRFPPEELDVAEREVVEALEKFKECESSGKWLNGYEELQTYQNLY